MGNEARHLLIYTDDPDKGGVAQYNHCLSLGLVEAGWKITLVQSFSDGWRVQEQKARGIDHRWIGYDTGKEFVRTMVDTADAARVFAELKPDIILFSDCCPVSNIAGRHAAISAGIPYVIVVNFAAPYLAERFSKCLPVLAGQYKKALEVVAVSTENKNLLHRSFGLPLNKGRVVYYGVPAGFFKPGEPDRRISLRQQFKIPLDSVVSITAARLDPVKGHVFQLHAMDILRREFPDTNLVSVWVGDGDLRPALEAEIAKMNLQKHFILAGRQSQMAEWYDAADIFTLTSSSEGMPISIMEAMAKGLPIVATGVSGVPEELGGEGVILPDPVKEPQRLVAELSRAWMRLEKNPSDRLRCGVAMRRRADELFHEEFMVQKTRGLLDSCLNRTTDQRRDGE